MQGASEIATSVDAQVLFSTAYTNSRITMMNGDVDDAMENISNDKYLVRLQFVRNQEQIIC